MRPPAIAYLAGMLLLLLGERVIGSADVLRYVLSGGGVLAILAGLGLQAREANTESGRLQLIFGAVGAASLLVYALSLDWFIDRLSLTEDGEYKTVTVLQSLWPILWLAGTMPFVALDRAQVINPMRTISGQSKAVALGWLSAAFAVAMLFPINYVGVDMNHQWDLGYFKTAQPGSATINLLNSLEKPVTAYLFFSPASDVTAEIRTYVEQLPDSNLAIEFVDHALEPELSKDLKIRGNGYIALVSGEGDDRQIERLKVGSTLDSARRKLKTLDADFFEGMMQVARGPRIAYIVTGHEEMYWRAQFRPQRRLNDFKKMLRQLNFQVKELGLVNGLTDAVPEDASVVFILSPTEDFLPEELETLNQYRRRGGRMLIALDPGNADLSALLDPIGVTYDGEVPLMTDQGYLQISRTFTDQVNLVTNKFTTHESVTTLTRNNQRLFVGTPEAGLMAKVTPSEEGVKNSLTIKAMESTWNDVNRNFKLDESEGEKRDTWPLAIAATGPAEGDADEFRVIVTADATWLSDLLLLQLKGNATMLLDSLSWLLEDEGSRGEVNDEEDVKIQHTKEGQGWIFYSTSLLLPLGFLIGGLVRVRMRQKRG